MEETNKESDKESVNSADVVATKEQENTESMTAEGVQAEDDGEDVDLGEPTEESPPELVTEEPSQNIDEELATVAATNASSASPAEHQSESEANAAQHETDITGRMHSKN